MTTWTAKGTVRKMDILWKFNIFMWNIFLWNIFFWRKKRKVVGVNSKWMAQQDSQISINGFLWTTTKSTRFHPTTILMCFLFFSYLYLYIFLAIMQMIKILMGKIVKDEIAMLCFLAFFILSISRFLIVTTIFNIFLLWTLNDKCLPWEASWTQERFKEGVNKKNKQIEFNLSKLSIKEVEVIVMLWVVNPKVIYTHTWCDYCPFFFLFFIIL